MGMKTVDDLYAAQTRVAELERLLREAVKELKKWMKDHGQDIASMDIIRAAKEKGI